MKKISVIVPIYNVEKYLKTCVDSIIKQTYQNLEILLIDDGSSDQSLTICNEYLEKDERVKVIHKKNEGVSVARNKGIEACSGSYVTFVDSDDWLESNAIETMVAILEAQSVECVRMSYFENFADGTQITKSLNSLNTGRYEHDTVSALIRSFIIGNEQCYVWLFLIKRDLLSISGGFVPDISMMEDTIFYVKLLSCAKSIFLSDMPKYHYYQNKQGATKQVNYYARNVDSILKVNAEIKKILKYANIQSSSIIDNMDTNHAIKITDYLVRMDREGTSRINIYRLFTKLYNNKSYRLLAANLQPTKIPIHVRLVIDTIINNQFKRMMFLLKIRRGMKAVRNLLLRGKYENI